MRCVGDGIAWRTLDYDRRAIAVLGDGHRVGRLADDVGLAAGLDAMDRLWGGERRFAIHNDLTDCLRHADLTIPARLNSQPTVELAEIKVSGKQTAAQFSRLTDKLDFISRGYRVGEKDSPARRIPPGKPLRAFQRPLSEAIALARRDGLADFSPDPCMSVAVADYGWIRRGPELFEDWAASAARKRGWDPAEPRVIQSLSLIRRLREHRNSFAFIAPYAIFPLNPGGHRGPNHRPA